jgi:hypothetical protein
MCVSGHCALKKAARGNRSILSKVLALGLLTVPKSTSVKSSHRFCALKIMSKRSIALVCTLSLLVGCSSSGPAAPALYPVKGVVKKGGQPVKGVGVSLYPAGGAKATGTPASGTTDDSGAFEMYSRAGKGVVEGTYKVVLTAPTAMADYSNPGKGGPKPSIELPKKLTAPESSDVTVTVTAGTETPAVNVDF